MDARIAINNLVTRTSDSDLQPTLNIHSNAAVFPDTSKSFNSQPPLDIRKTSSDIRKSSPEVRKPEDNLRVLIDRRYSATLLSMATQANVDKQMKGVEQLRVPDVQTRLLDARAASECPPTRGERKDVQLTLRPREVNQVSCNGSRVPTENDAQINSRVLVTVPPSSATKSYSLPRALSGHFSVNGQPVGGVVSAICHSCGAIVKSSLKATSNLITHLKRCDPNRHSKYCEDRKQKLPWLRSNDMELARDQARLVVSAATSVSTAAETGKVASRTRSSPAKEYSLPRSLTSHFTVSSGPVFGNISAQCLNCGSNVKASLKATSNLITHLKRCSPLRYEQYCHDRQRKRYSRDSLVSMVVHPTVQFPTSSISELDPKLLGARNSKQHRMIKNLVLCIASDHLPISVMKSSNFRNLLLGADITLIIPSADVITDYLIPYCVRKIQDQVVIELTQLKQVYLMVDVWRDENSMIFLTYSVNFIDDFWVFQTRFLGVYALEKRDKSIVLSTYSEIVEKFQISHKVNKVIVRNLTLGSSYGLEFVLPTDSVDQADSFEEEFTDLLSCLPNTFRCFCQSQNLCVKDAFENSDVKFSTVIPTLQKAVNLMELIGNTPVTRQYLQNKGISFMNGDSKTWNSRLERLAHLVQHETELNETVNVLSMLQQCDLKLSKAEFTELTNAMKVLTPFLESIKYINCGKISATGPVAIGLRNSLRGVSESELIFCKSLRKALEESVQNRLEPLIRYDDIKAASFFDPRFKLEWISDQGDKDDLLNYLRSLLNPEVCSRRGGPGVDLNPAIKARKLDPKFTATIKQECLDGPKSLSNPVNIAFTCYLTERLMPFDTDPLLYWRLSPPALSPLAALAREFLPCSATPSAQELVEYQRSVEKSFYSNAKSRHGRNGFKNLIFIDRNRDLMNAVL